MTEPDNLVLQLLREIRAEIAGMRVETANEFSELRSEMHSLRADVASDILTVNARIDATRKELCEQIVGLRRAMMEYHSSVIGHGVLFTELDERVRRLEQHLNLPPRETH